MKIVKTDNMNNARLLTVRQLMAYTGMGYQRARVYADEIGATVKLSPRIIRYDKRIIDAAIDKLVTNE